MSQFTVTVGSLFHGFLLRQPCKGKQELLLMFGKVRTLVQVLVATCTGVNLNHFYHMINVNIYHRTQITQSLREFKSY